jgi:hypothetical protein
LRIRRFIAKYTINPAITHGFAHLVGSVEVCRSFYLFFAWWLHSLSCYLQSLLWSFLCNLKDMYRWQRQTTDWQYSNGWHLVLKEGDQNGGMDWDDRLAS